MSMLAYPLSTASQGSTVTRRARLLWDGHVDGTSEDTHRKLWKGLVAATSEGASSADTSVTSATNPFCFHAVTSDTKS